MEEEKVNTVSIRIYEDTQIALLEEQARLKRVTGEKPSFADLVRQLWEARDAFRGQSADPLDGLPSSDRQIVLKLIAMMRDDETERLPAVRLMVKNYESKKPLPEEDNGTENTATKSPKSRKQA